jgi:hypothetical protein
MSTTSIPIALDKSTNVRFTAWRWASYLAPGLVERSAVERFATPPNTGPRSIASTASSVTRSARRARSWRSATG